MADRQDEATQQAEQKAAKAAKAAGWRHRFLTLGISLVGVAIFWGAGMPLPFLFGPMFACLVASLLGMPLEKFGVISKGARTILGVAIGTSLTPAVIAMLPQMGASILLVPIFILVIGLVGVPFFRKVWGFDPATAYYAAMPGGLQDMVIFGIEAGGNPRALSLIHATRVLLILTIAPILLTHLYGASLDQPLGENASQLPLSDIVLMVIAALVGWKGAERIGLFGATILGPMIVAAIFSLTGLIGERPPKEAILFAQFFIGSGIGVYFVGVTLAELRRVVVAGMAYVLLLAVLSWIFSHIVTGLGFGQPIEAFLAFAPGGQAEMTILAITSGADLGYVVTHHLTRIMIVISGAPVVAAFINRRQSDRRSKAKSRD